MDADELLVEAAKSEPRHRRTVGHLDPWTIPLVRRARSGRRVDAEAKAKLGSQLRERYAKIQPADYTCAWCGRTFQSRDMARKAQFCSVACAKKRSYYAAEVLEKTCLRCGATFTTRSVNDADHCSDRCGWWHRYEIKHNLPINSRKDAE
jgi:ribosomal protein L34E